MENWTENQTMYQPEELLPLTAWLADKYTSKESSSVTYDTAQMLMESVLYCIREYESDNKTGLVSGKRPDAGEAYRAGYDRVIEKVHKAKAVYEELLRDFEDYGCRNYRDTILKGMPAFFLSYDARFQPQNHVITLDYPIVKNYKLCGADMIYRYLCDIVVEKRFLECFHPEAVRGLLSRMEGEFDCMYMGNLCELVLMAAIGCMMAGKSAGALEFSKEDWKRVQARFCKESRERTEKELHTFLVVLLEKAGIPESAEYFAQICHEYAVRLGA